MAVKRTQADGLAIEIEAILAEYEGACQEVLNKSAMTAATDARNELRQTSPKKTGKYASGWAVKNEMNTLNGTVTATVYNAKKPQLTHLLENGHAKVNGGRVNGIPHIRPADKRAVEEFERLVKEALERG